MPENKNLDRALAECLDAVQNHNDTVDGCLARYPALTGELAPLLRTAAALRSLPPAQPDPAFRAVAATRLLNIIRAGGAAPGRRRPIRLPALSWRSLAWRLAAVLVVLSLVGGGTVWAASDTMPDHPLYGVKLATERLQLSLSPAAEARFGLYLQQSDRRLAEAAAMTLAGKYGRAAVALTAYEAIMSDLEAALNLAAARHVSVAPLVDDFQLHMARQEAVLQRAYNNVTPQSRPALLRLIASVRASQSATLTVLRDSLPRN